MTGRWWIRGLVGLCDERYRREHGDEAVADAERWIDEAERSGFVDGLGARIAVAVDLTRTVIDRRRDRRSWRPGMTRRSGGGSGMPELMRSLRVATRALLRSPSFTFVAVATIALGVGANAAVFTVIDAALLRALPYPSDDRLVVVDGLARSTGVGYPLGYLDVEELKQRTRLLEGLTARTWERSFNLVGRDASENITGELATSTYFETLGVSPQRGRTFDAAEDVPGIHAVAVIGHGLWQSWFAGAADVVGRSIELDGRIYEVIGVMPEGYRGLTDNAVVWLPLSMAGTLYGEHYLDLRPFRWMSTVARLSPGATVASAQRELEGIATALRADYPAENEDLVFTVSPLRDAVFGDLGARLVLLWAAAGFVLLVACANVANLFLVRGVVRSPETMLRAALGASRTRIASGFMLEGALVVFAGGVLGCLIAALLTGTIVNYSGVRLPTFVHVSLGARIVLVMLVLVTIAATLATLVPSWLATRFTRRGSLVTGDRGGTTGRRSGRLQGTLVIGQVALALMLLIGSVLTLRGFVALVRRDLGFDAENLLTMRMDVKAERFRQNTAFWALSDQVLEAASATPGVSSVALAGPRIPTDGWNAGHIWIEDRVAEGLDAQGVIVETHNVSPEYFDLLGIEIIAGRPFSPQDRDVRTSTPVVIVNRAFAEHFWPDQNAIGKRMRFAVTMEAVKFEIAGIVEEVRDEGLAGSERPTSLDVYLPLYQAPPRLPPQLNLLVRTTLDPALVVPSLRERLRSFAPDVPLFDVKMMEERLAEQTTSQRFLILLMTAFAGLSLTLASVGIYGLMAYRVAQQRRELGVRLALGALPGDLVRMVLRRAAWLTTGGIVFGAVGARVLVRFLESTLNGVSPGDPFSFGVAATVLAAVALASSLLPALRAARVDPMKSMVRE